jgi:lysophospholipase L1-like esterase
MPLGDSITDGMQVLGGYRSDLWQLMTTDGRPVRFVGSRNSGPPQLGDRNHEGHPGWRIDQIYTHARNWLTAYQPQTVLLHIGTNDINENYRPAAAPARLSRLIDLITTTLPRTRLYVATIGPFTQPPVESRAQTYNARIRKIVAAKTASNGRVQLVDMHSSLTRADISPDGIHPTDGGYSKMAARWYGALSSTQLVRWEAEDPRRTVVDNGERLWSPKASGNGKVGYLDSDSSQVRFTVKVAASGPYRLYVRGATGLNTHCSQSVTVNGRPQGEVRYSPYGWDQWTITGTGVWLNEGDNTLGFTQHVCSAELDSIDLAHRNTQSV